MERTRSDEALLRLAELALANGWPAGEVAKTLSQAVGPKTEAAARSVQAAPEPGVSKVVLNHFAKPRDR